MLAWKNESRTIGELIPYKFNPRKIDESKLEELKLSIKASGYNAPILVDTDNTIIAGHQRWHILKELGYESVDVRTPERKLTDDEFQRINIQDNLPFGDWDMNALEEHFHLEDLLEWGMDEELFSKHNEEAETKDYSDSVGDSNYKIIVDCTTENEQQELYSRLLNDGYKCKIL